MEDPAGVVAQIQNQRLKRAFFVETLELLDHVLDRVLLELRNTQITHTVVQDLTADRLHLDHITHQRKDQRLRFTFTQDRQNHRALGLAAHELDGIIELQPLGRLVINLDNEIARFNPCAGGGRIFDRRHDFDEAVLGTHFDPKAAEFALSPCL